METYSNVPSSYSPGSDRYSRGTQRKYLLPHCSESTSQRGGRKRARYNWDHERVPCTRRRVSPRLARVGAVPGLRKSKNSERIPGTKSALLRGVRSRSMYNEDHEGVPVTTNVFPVHVQVGVVSRAGATPGTRQTKISRRLWTVIHSPRRYLAIRRGGKVNRA